MAGIFGAGIPPHMRTPSLPCPRCVALVSESLCSSFILIVSWEYLTCLAECLYGLNVLIKGNAWSCAYHTADIVQSFLPPVPAPH